MNNLSTSQVLDIVRTIAFEQDQSKRGEYLLINGNQILSEETSARTRRAAFKAVIRLTKEVYNFSTNLSTKDRDELEQAYYILTDRAAADRFFNA